LSSNNSNYVEYEKAKALLEENEYIAAANIFFKFTSEFTHYFDARFYLGSALIFGEKDMNGHLITDDEKANNLKIGLEILDEVWQNKEKLVEIPHYRIAYRYGDALARANNFVKAVTLYKISLQEVNEKERRIPLTNLGLVYFKLRQYENSLIYYRKTLDKFPNDYYALNNYAYALATINRSNDAKFAIEKAIKLINNDPKSPKNMKASSLHSAAIIEFQLGNHNNAIKLLRESLRNNKYHHEARINLASIFIQLGYHKKAFGILRYAEKHDYGDAGKLYYCKALCLNAFGKKKEAESELKKARHYFRSKIDRYRRTAKGKEWYDTITMVEVYNYLGLVEGGLMNHSKAIEYFDFIVNFYERTIRQDKITADMHLVHAYRNKGIAYSLIDNNDCIKYFNKALRILREAGIEQDFGGEGNVTAKVYTLNGLGVAYVNKWKNSDRNKEDSGNAVECFLEAIRLFPKKAYGPLHTLALLDDWNNDFKESLKKYQSVSENIWYKGFMGGYIGSGHAYMQLDDYNSAIRCFNKAIQVYGNPNTLKDDLMLAEAYRSLGFIELLNGKSDKSKIKAKKFFKKAIQKDSAFAMSSKGHLLLNLGEYEKAIKYLEKALEKSNTNDLKSKMENESKEYITPLTLAYKGLALSFLREYHQAHLCFESALKLESKMSHIFPYRQLILNYRGLCFYLQQRFDDAIQDFTEAIDFQKTEFKNSKCEKAQKFPYAKVNLGYAYIGKKWYLKAEKCFDEVMDDLLPKFNKRLDRYRDANVTSMERFLLAYILNGLGQCFMAKGAFDKAMEFFSESMNVDPTIRNHSLISLGVCKYRQEDYVNALGYFRKVDDYNEEIDRKYINRDLLTAAQKHNNMGLCYYNLGLIDEAREEFYKALKLNSQLDDSYYNLGLIETNEQNTNRAKTLFHTALAINQKNIEAKNALEKIQAVGKSPDWYEWWFRTSKYKRYFGWILVSLIGVFIAIAFLVSLGTSFDFSWVAFENVTTDVPVFIADFFGYLDTIQSGINVNSINGQVVPVTTDLSDLPPEDKANGEDPKSNGIDGHQPNIAIILLLVFILVIILLLPSLKTVKIGNVELETASIDMPAIDLRPAQLIVVGSHHMPLHFHVPLNTGISVSYLQ
jgi:tetratricopeptide (TPR) repeat protein